MGGWGLAKEFYSILTAEIRKTLNDRNSAASDEERVGFEQCFHFRYRDTARMLTVGGVLLHKWASDTLGQNAFAGLPFVRNGEEAFEIKPPMMTGREVRYLNTQMLGEVLAVPNWISEEDLENYRSIYRYYPIFAESEL